MKLPKVFKEILQSRFFQMSLVLSILIVVGSFSLSKFSNQITTNELSNAETQEQDNSQEEVTEQEEASGCPQGMTYGRNPNTGWINWDECVPIGSNNTNNNYSSETVPNKTVPKTAEEFREIKNPFNSTECNTKKADIYIWICIQMS